MNILLTTECVAYDQKEMGQFEDLGIESNPEPVFLKTQFEIDDIKRHVQSHIEREGIEYETSIVIFRDNSRAEVLEPFENISKLRQQYIDYLMELESR